MNSDELCLIQMAQRITERRATRPENLLKIARALNVSVDYLLTGDIIDKDLLLLSEKLNKLTPTQFRTVENIVNECISLNEKAE